MERQYALFCAYLATTSPSRNVITEGKQSPSCKKSKNPKKKSKKQQKVQAKKQLEPVLTEEDYENARLEKLKNYKYMYTFPSTIDFSTYVSKYSHVEKGSRHHEIKHSFYCRVLEHRQASKKLIFYTVRQNNVQLQLLSDMKEYSNESQFYSDNDIIRRGDIVGVHGFVGKSNPKTKPGELSLYVTKIVLLAPCYKMLPKYTGLVDPEIRARKRYLDLIANPENKEPFVIRSEIFRIIRNYMYVNKFMEAHTPIVSANAGGATAKPFITYHNDLKQNMFLRIAPELYLKKLIVSGFPRVYEMGPVFRNEDCDKTHNSEFYTLEYYKANSDYNDLMNMCETMLTEIVSNFYPDLLVPFLPMHQETEVMIDFSAPYQRIDIMTELAKHGIEMPSDMYSKEAMDYLDAKCVELKVDCSPPRTTSRLLDKMIGHYIEPQCINPTYVCNHPLVMSPLAKVHRDDPNLSERFELFVCGTELANAFSELNDPFEQEKRFRAQQKDRMQGDDETPLPDQGYVDALKYGMVPTAGLGMGIDRLCMYLSNRNTIRDVILFPSMSSVSSK